MKTRKALDVLRKTSVEMNGTYGVLRWKIMISVGLISGRNQGKDHVIGFW